MTDRVPKSRKCLVFVRVGDSSAPSPLDKGEVRWTGVRKVCDICPSAMGGYSCSLATREATDITSGGIGPRTANIVNDDGEVVASEVPVCKHLDRIVPCESSPD